MTKLEVWLYHTVVKTSTNWIGKACANLTSKMPIHFNIIGWGPNGPSPKTSFSLAADRLPCALPRVPHFGRWTTQSNYQK